MVAAASHDSWHIVGAQEILMEGEEEGREGEFVKRSPQQTHLSLSLFIFIFYSVGLLGSVRTRR